VTGMNVLSSVDIRQQSVLLVDVVLACWRVCVHAGFCVWVSMSVQDINEEVQVCVDASACCFYRAFLALSKPCQNLAASALPVSSHFIVVQNDGNREGECMIRRILIFYVWEGKRRKRGD
jgi:hypothetical protein